MDYAALTAALLPRIARRPVLALELMRVSWRFRRLAWWRRFPFLPIPAEEYVRWRMYTAYGDENAEPPAADLDRYARWATRK